MTDDDLKLLDHFSQFISEHRKELIERVLGLRTRHITVVLEDVYNSQNASAVLRTCECMGIQDLHIVEQLSKYDLNPRVLRGAHKWLDLHRYNDRSFNNTELAFNKLRSQGYRILAADPAPGGKSIQDIDVSESKIAIVFGNELRGVSEYGMANCDEAIRIPMYGFTESLNLSVSVAISLNTVVSKLRHSTVSFSLSESEKNALKLAWYRKIVRGSDIIEREFLRSNE